MRQESTFANRAVVGIAVVCGVFLFCVGASAPDWFRDRFLFSYISRDEMGKPWNLWTMNLNGSNLRRISHEEHWDDAPDWCPITRQIVCLSSRNEEESFGDVYVMDATGANAVRLTKQPSAKSSPSWSPDGKNVAYVSSANDRDDIHIVDVRGKRIRPLLEGGHGAIGFVDWSPTGKGFVFSATGADGQSEIYVIDSSGRDVTQLTNAVGEVADERPLWSPDGKQILFIRKMDKDSAILHRMDADGKNVRALTDGSLQVNLAMWSPDGGMIAYAAPDHLMHIVDVGGNELHSIPLPLGWISEFQWVDETLAVSPQGRGLFSWGWLKGE